MRFLADATDAEVVFAPHDPAAHDASAVAGEEEIGWSAAHIVVHATASSEEGAAIAATLARGVEPQGRSRYETPWELVTSVAQLRARLAESRRMRGAFLDAWPDQPNLELTYTPIPQFGPMNAATRLAFGLLHEDGHLAQLRAAISAARAAQA